VTFRDFHKYGVRWESIAPAIRELVALGFVRITQYGVASAAEFRAPNMFALTHLPTKGGASVRAVLPHAAHAAPAPFCLAWTWRQAMVRDEDCARLLTLNFL